MTDKEIIKRLEAENEKLKKEILSQNDYILQLSADSEKMEWLEDDIKELKAENERLKKENFDYNIACTRLEEYGKCLKQTLQEIKEIAENIVNNDDKPSCVNDADCPLNGGLGYDNHCNTKCPFILGKHILEKISEVEND